MKVPFWLALAVLAGALPLSAHAQHAGHTAAAVTAPQPGWTSLPLVVARARGPAGAEVALTNSAASDVMVEPPKGAPRIMALSNGRATLKPEVGNYHLLRAVETCDSHTATASTAVYFSNPGPAPTALLAAAPDGLAVVPERLPREHAAYRAGEVARFRVTFNGKPQGGAKVRFETSNGTRTEATAQPDGSIAITFPEDFPPRDQRPPEAHGRPTEAQFVIAAIGQIDGAQHIGAFNYSYRPGAYDGMSLWAGMGFAALGMVSAVPFLRRRDKGDRP